MGDPGTAAAALLGPSRVMGALLRGAFLAAPFLLGACAGPGGPDPGRADALATSSARVSEEAGASGASEFESEPVVPSATPKPEKAAVGAARGMKLVGVPAGADPLNWYDSVGPFLHAVSADEVWVTGEDSLYRYRDGQWKDAKAGSDCLAEATDGALWSVAYVGGVDYPGGGRLMRSTEKGSRELAESPVLCGYGAAAFAGPEGSMWVIQNDEVTQVWPDGRRSSIGRPERVDRVCLHGVDPVGNVWVTELSDVDDEECTAGDWHSWNGRSWQQAKKPDPFTSAYQQVISGDGVGWTVDLDTSPDSDSTRITLFADGARRVIAKEPGMASLTPAPDGGACVLRYPDPDSIDADSIVCYDADGEIGSINVSGLDIEGVSVAPDGAIWVGGSQIARIGRMSDLS